jgi:uncharacterized protein involved in exopolysaccharide biosynthesis
MEEKEIAAGPPGEPGRKDAEEDEISLLDLVCVLVKRKRLVLGCFFGFAVLALAAALFSTPIFKAETTLLPPQTSKSGASAMLAQLGGLADLAGGAAGIKSPGDLYVGLLKSRTVVDRVIRRFDLMKYYEADEWTPLRGMIVKDVLDAQSDLKSGIITVAVSDKDPVLATRMANAFVEELKRLTQGLAISEAAQRRLFFEEQVRGVRGSLAKAEDALKDFQEKSGVVAVDPQMQAVITGIGELRARAAATEVQLRAMRTYSTGENPEVRKVQAQLAGLKAQLARMEGAGKGYDPLMPTRRIPEAGLEYARLTRDVQFNAALYGLLLKQFEAAKLDEAQEAAVLQVIDPAVVPDHKDKPKRALMVVLGGMLGLFLGIFAAFVAEFLENARRDPEAAAKLAFVRSGLSWRRRRG